MKPKFSTDKASSRIVLWPLLAILVGCTLGIIARNWSLGLAIGLLGGVGFMHANFQFEGRKDQVFLWAAYALVLLATVLAARGRPELVWLLLFAAAMSEILHSGRKTKKTPNQSSQPTRSARG